MMIVIAKFIAPLVLAPLLPGVINKVKAFFGGRKGPPLLQLYFDLYKLCHKTPVYSVVSTGVFRLAPVIALGTVAASLLVLPFAGESVWLSFEGDVLFVIYLLGLARLAIVLAALDTGSSFEGMGASREVQFAVFAEPALFLALAALVLRTGETSLSSIFRTIASSGGAGPALALAVAALCMVFLAENSRVPVDDPNTHLELTMIHEVMVLDHSGPDLAFILYAAALKLWALGSLIVCAVMPSYGVHEGVNAAAFIAGMMGLAGAVGLVESVLARLRLLKVPYFLMSALAFSILAIIFQVGR